MNVFLVLATSVTVSIDSFFVGFSVSLGKRDNSLPVTVAAVTYVMCILASLLGQKLALHGDGRYFGATILLLLGVFNLLKQDEPVRTASVLNNLMTAASVGVDGATAALALTIQNEGDVLFTPLLFAATHFFATFAGQTLAQNTRARHGNVWAAIFLFAIAAMKFLGL